MDFQKNCISLNPKRLQGCPFCGERQEIIIRGLVEDLDDSIYREVGDIGYSFCNCRNIFFTDWKNIDSDIYNPFYVKKFKNPKDEKLKQDNCENMWPVVHRHNPGAKRILIVGDTDDVLPSIIKRSNWNNSQITIVDKISRDSKFDLVVSNFEDYQTDEMFDIIWMAHIVEHFRNPKAVMEKVRNLLSVNGIVYVSMPDNHYIDFFNAANTGAWYVREHHILWNIFDWVSFVEETGLECIFKQLSSDVINVKLSNGKEEKSWIKESRTIFLKRQ